jgi:mono/diheme cytochrome c family protein
MKLQQRAVRFVGVVGGVAFLLAGACNGDSGPVHLDVGVADAGPEVGPDGSGATGGAGGGISACRLSPRASEDLTPRVDVTTPSVARRVVRTSDLFTRFNSICGGCHVSAANGGFQASAATFAAVFDASRLARIESNEPGFAMPPEGKAFSSRPATDPVRILASYLEPWIAQGRPVDMFVMDGPPTSADSSAASYSYSAMTNLGDCVPATRLYASSASGEMDAKDTLFASATQTTLPTDLADTDLTTFDTAALAANGVIAFRPTYPLWSDGSGKLRFIRVPKGTSVGFDKAKQTFDIPPNTRFYKTFFREVIDKAGRVSHKKMETRLIVVRPEVDVDSVAPQPAALFGTYRWSDDEMTATLWDGRNRNGDPNGFSDVTQEYITNEVHYQDVIDNIGPGSGTLSDKLRQELNNPKHAGLVQHYAIPGSLRCIQCHEGSPTHDFALGFYPIQIAQRAADSGGVYDPVEADELNQLQRFIDYGLITGMASPADVVLLESSQAPRAPRTDEELKAQAYMIGNCAHCHNPHGYPSRAKAALSPVLNFLPGSADDAGVFQFPLDRMSPVRSRGANQDISIPYITPSLRDYPVTDANMVRLDNGAAISAPKVGSTEITEVTWSPKYDVEVEGAASAPGCTAVGNADINGKAFCGLRRSGHSFVAAPWRSILYRNVDTPFPYFDDYVPFPHMPMNSPGFDCRAPRIMGDWMVGLPAVLKPQYLGMSEDTLPHFQNRDGSYFADFIDAPQPYQEVKPGDEGYAAAQAAARDRLAEYHGGVRYQYCQDVLSPDILDPVGQGSTTTTSLAHTEGLYYPVPERFIYGGIPPADPSHPGQYVQPPIGVPYHGEWFAYDPTEKSPWEPRRSSWETVVVKGIPDDALPVNRKDTGLTNAETDARRRLTAALQKADLSDELRSYATNQIPYALWENKPECAAKFASGFANGSLKKVSDFDGNRPLWMDEVQPPPAADAPVYMMAPGAALYRHICINCHGPKADGKGLQSDALAASSEGQARPADLAEGLFGPPEMLGSNLLRTFNQGTSDPHIADKFGSRYMAWMTLGGTLQLIPHDVINQVEATQIFGERRKNLSKLGLTETVSANMLNLAKGLCALALPDRTDASVQFAPGRFLGPLAPDQYIPITDPSTPYVRTNGDWEMWMKLCSERNRQLVRVYYVRRDGDEAAASLAAIYFADNGGASPAYQFPATGKVWDHNQRVRTNGVTADNYYPACVEDPSKPAAMPGEPPQDPANLPSADGLARLLGKFTMPTCDPTFLRHGELTMWTAFQNSPEQVDNVREWALQGAINAGMSVFSYLEQANLAHSSLPPYYSECQLLP